MLLEGIDWRRPARTHKPTQVQVLRIMPKAAYLLAFRRPEPAIHELLFGKITAMLNTA